MNIQIITSSYPAFPGDPGGTAGLFVESFAQELVHQGHRVVVQPVQRKSSYEPQGGVIVEPIPWQGGDQVLAAMSLSNPGNWRTFYRFFKDGRRNTQAIHQKYAIDRTLCMWVVPCGMFGYWIHKKFNAPYDVWALGSDIWKIRRVPIIGPRMITQIIGRAQGIFADGVQLCADVKAITGRNCQFLASTRKLPEPNDVPTLKPEGKKHFLFVGRFHPNKGPDLLLEAVKLIKSEVRERIHVHMYGLGDMEDRLRHMIRELNLQDCVTLNGPIQAQDLANVLKAVDYLVIPSRIESIPVIFSDALQMGVPVVSMPVGDLTKMINLHQCGVVADEASAQALSVSLEAISGRDSEQFQMAIKKAYQTFSIEQSISEWLKS